MSEQGMIKVEVCCGTTCYLLGAQSLLALEKSMPAPIISTACPAILELILMKYHDLRDHLLATLAPVDVAAKLARERAVAKGVPEEDIGVYFISPCPAKVFALKMGLGVDRPYVDRVLSVSDAYMRIVPAMEKLEEVKPLCRMSAGGLSWGISRGEANATGGIKTIAADGVEQCVKILEALEDGGLGDMEFIELNACVSGCVGVLKSGVTAFLLLAEGVLFLPAVLQCLFWQLVMLGCAAAGEALGQKELAAVLTAAGKAAGLLLSILLCSMLMMTVSSVAIVLLGGGSA